MGSHKSQQPHHRRDTDNSNLKLHLRLATIAGRTYRLITLRPDTQAAFSTNNYHATWHIVSDPAGARLLARLLWGLAYQRQPDTLIVLHGAHLKPTPFDGDPSEPILLAASHLTRLDAKTARVLKARLPHLGNPMQTVRWQTFGLDALLSEQDRFYPLAESRALDWAENRWQWQHEQMHHLGGCLCYMAPPALLRYQAFQVYRVGAEAKPGRDNSHYLAENSRVSVYGDGEVQIFTDYRERRTLAMAARREVLAEAGRPQHPDDLHRAIYARYWEVEDRRAQMRGRRRL